LTQLKRTVDAGLIDANETAKGEPLQVHLEGKTDADGAIIMPGYKQHLEAKGDTADHVTLTVSRIRHLFEGAGVVFWKDLAQPGAETRLASWLGKRRAEGEITVGTLNYYSRAVRSFGGWMKESRRASTNYLAGLHGVLKADAEKQETRPLSAEEMRRLIAAAKTGASWRTFSGDYRAILYALA